MKYVKLVALASLTIVASASIASAEIVTYTFTGTASGRDLLHDFGQSDTVADAFKATLTFDLSAGAYYHQTYADGFSITAYSGGSANNLPTFGASTLTIGGHSVALDGSFEGGIYQNTYAENLALGVFANQYYGIAFGIPINTIPVSDAVYSFSNPTSGIYEQNTTYRYYDDPTYLSLTPTSLTVSVGTTVSSVPLPASAPLFGASLLALGAVGYGLSARRWRLRWLNRCKSIDLISNLPPA